MLAFVTLFWNDASLWQQKPRKKGNNTDDNKNGGKKEKSTGKVMSNSRREDDAAPGPCDYSYWRRLDAAGTPAAEHRATCCQLTRKRTFCKFLSSFCCYFSSLSLHSCWSLRPHLFLLRNLIFATISDIAVAEEVAEMATSRDGDRM
jgi:hypothetical protein